MTDAEAEAFLVGVLESAKVDLAEILETARNDYRLWLEGYRANLVSKACRAGGGDPGKVHDIKGWTVAFSGGYYRLHKSIDGKGHSIHLGRELDVDKALRKIREKMAKLGAALTCR